MGSKRYSTKRIKGAQHPTPTTIIPPRPSQSSQSNTSRSPVRPRIVSTGIGFSRDGWVLEGRQPGCILNRKLSHDTLGHILIEDNLIVLGIPLHSDRTPSKKPAVKNEAVANTGASYKPGTGSFDGVMQNLRVAAVRGAASKASGSWSAPATAVGSFEGDVLEKRDTKENKEETGAPKQEKGTTVDGGSVLKEEKGSANKMEAGPAKEQDAVDIKGDSGPKEEKGGENKTEVGRAKEQNGTAVNGDSSLEAKKGIETEAGIKVGDAKKGAIIPADGPGKTDRETDANKAVTAEKKTEGVKKEEAAALSPTDEAAGKSEAKTNTKAEKETGHTNEDEGSPVDGKTQATDKSEEKPDPEIEKDVIPVNEKKEAPNSENAQD